MGALLAGFPLAYATLLSSLYIPITLLIFALIFRAVAIEFRSKRPMPWWRQTWDTLFSMASIGIALGVGISLGNLIQGIPLDQNHDYIGTTLSTFFRPYPLLVGILTLALFTQHGTIFLIMKTEGDLQERIKRWSRPALVFFIMTYAVTTAATLIYQDHMTHHIRSRPLLFLVVVASMVAIANIPREIEAKRYGRAFISSCANIALLFTLFAIGTFPDIIRSTVDPPTNSVTIARAAASTPTLRVLVLIAGIGLPFVFGYGYYIYRLFRGKVKLDKMSY
jgi:cytochrome d ubiquinol oxidase subunit II